MKKTICVAGKNDIAVDVLEFCINKYKEEYEIVAVTNRNDIGKATWQRSLRKYCVTNDIKIISLEETYDISNLVFLSVEFDRIIKTELFKTESLFNIHFSLLPKYKGMYPSVLPILNGEDVTGVTLHKMQNGIDTGEIIAQKIIKIEDNDNALDLYMKLMYKGKELLLENIDNLLNGNYLLKEQEAKGSTYFSTAAIDYKNLRLNERATAYQIKKQVLAYAFRPYQLLNFKGVGIIDATITDKISDDSPGTVLFEDEISFKISSIDYDVILYKDVLSELFECIAKQENEKAEFLCTSNKIINDKDEHGWSPLIVAVYNNNLHMTKYLIDRGSDIEVTNNNGTNLLMYAKDCYIRNNDLTILKYLIEKGLSAYKKDYSGKNLIDYCRNENINLENIL